MHALEVKNLVKNYEKIAAVKNISFSVDKNSFFAFLGPNGAGKSTTINIISTLLSKNEGSIKVFEHTLGSEDDQIRKKIGVVFQGSMLDELQTVRENLQIRGSFYHLSYKEIDDRIDEINDYLVIKPFLDQRYGELSGGQQRKADIARALLNWPSLLILDEPTTGLDPKSRKDIWKLISNLQLEKEITIFLTTHYMEEVHDADKVIIINEGNIVAEGTSEELRLKYSSDRLKILPKNNLAKELTKDGIDFYLANNTLNIILDDCFKGLDFVSKYKAFIKDFEILRGDMDDVFVNITGRKLVSE